MLSASLQALVFASALYGLPEGVVTVRAHRLLDRLSHATRQGAKSCFCPHTRGAVVAGGYSTPLSKQAAGLPACTPYQACWDMPPTAVDRSGLQHRSFCRRRLQTDWAACTFQPRRRAPLVHQPAPRCRGRSLKLFSSPSTSSQSKLLAMESSMLAVAVGVRNARC